MHILWYIEKIKSIWSRNPQKNREKWDGDNYIVAGTATLDGTAGIFHDEVDNYLELQMAIKLLMKLPYRSGFAIYEDKAP